MRRPPGRSSKGSNDALGAPPPGGGGGTAQRPGPGVRDVQAVLEPGAIRTAYQPVFELSTGRVVGYEALARFDQQPDRKPEDWFAIPDRRMEHRLELAAIRAHVSRFGEIPAPAYVALNVSPATAVSKELSSILASLPAKRIVLEITARAAVDDYDDLHARLAALRSRGVRLAVDDAGAGLASLRQVLQLNPDIIKLDVSLTRGVDADPARRSLASALVAFAGQMGIAVIAEGIETAAEFTTLLDLGVGYGQGFFLAHPEKPQTGPLAAARVDAGPVVDTVAAPIKVAIVDDHAMVAQAVAAMLGAQPGLEVSGVASDLAQAFELVDRTATDVVVCDIQLGDESGFSLLRRYENCERPRVVMYSSYDHPVYHRAAFEGGAAGFVLKMAEPRELIDSIRSAAAGRTSFSPATMQAVRSAGDVPTARELAVLERLADGQSTAQVAAALGIRPRTVESHLRALFDRAGVLSRTELVLHAIRQGWIRPRAARSTDQRTADTGSPAWLVDVDLIKTAPRERALPRRSPDRRGEPD
jgi:EAL domain-containing protein (putative c-di-GMP-specific phosphodiesterase class I)/DNA-binding NarL/FixJ family response regulator